MPNCPLARSQELVVEPLDDELLVFDSRVDRAHSLNPTAAAVWRACDGTRDRDQLAAECGLDPAAVDLALESLRGCGLLVEGFTATTERVSRRAVLRRLAVRGAAAGVALPVIRSIAAPSAYAATSGGKAGHTCTSATNANNSCSATSRCHSDGLCHPGSTCDTGGGAHTGHCASHPCCVGYSCVGCASASHSCRARGARVRRGEIPCF